MKTETIVSLNNDMSIMANERDCQQRRRGVVVSCEITKAYSPILSQWRSMSSLYCRLKSNEGVINGSVKK
jgi:hypothetical protein